MNELEIRKAIHSARRGISQYLWLMRSLHRVDVATEQDFQRRYNAFYRVRQRPSDWYFYYFQLLESRKDTGVCFEEVLDQMWQRTGRYEPSFCSKLVATIDSAKPVWDRFVLKNIGLRAPSYASRTKMQDAPRVYRKICDWYSKYLGCQEGQAVIEIFRQEVPEHNEVSDLKKLDFVLWQLRA